jgi:hypothetical protein
MHSPSHKGRKRQAASRPKPMLGAALVDVNDAQSKSMNLRLAHSCDGSHFFLILVVNHGRSPTTTSEP